jgi:hypothetical protein
MMMMNKNVVDRLDHAIGKERPGREDANNAEISAATAIPKRKTPRMTWKTSSMPSAHFVGTMLFGERAMMCSPYAL